MWSWPLLWVGLFPTISMVPSPCSLAPWYLTRPKSSRSSPSAAASPRSARSGSVRSRRSSPRVHRSWKKAEAKETETLSLEERQSGVHIHPKKRVGGEGQLMFFCFFCLVWWKTFFLDRSFWQCLLKIVIAWKEIKRNSYMGQQEINNSQR